MYIYKVEKVIFEYYSIWCCGNFLDKRKLTNLNKKTLHVHFVEPINWLCLYLFYNWFMQWFKLVSAIFLYQQMIALENLRKMLFISSKSFLFVLKIFKFLYFPHPLFFPLPAIAWEDDRKINPKVYDITN